MRAASGQSAELRARRAVRGTKLESVEAEFHDGISKDLGMVSWSANMTPVQVESIRLYVIERANEDEALELRAAKAAAQ